MFFFSFGETFDLIGRTHPIGGTGCRMLTEISKQVQGRAEGRQVPDAKIGLCHNLGGAFSVCTTTILGLRD